MHSCTYSNLKWQENLIRTSKMYKLLYSTSTFDCDNHIEDDFFPCYLRNVSMLHVLVLQSNKFYWLTIDCGGSNVNWPMLQIVDLASN